MMIEVVPTRSVALNNLEWVYDTPHTLACRPKTLHEGGTFHARRSHKKSRSGCCNCKRRRVKCDERKPECDKCAQQRLTCNYLNAASPSDIVSETSTDSPWSSAVTSSMSLDLVEAQLRRAVMPEHCDKPTFSVSARAAGGSLIEVMDHFHHVASGTIGTPGMQEMMKSRVFQLAQDSAILINAVVAFSATHLRTLRPGDKKLQSISQHHSKISLQLYRHEMKNGVAFERVDAMVATCFLVSAMAFFTEDSSPSASFVFSDDPRASEWISVVSGFATILWKGRTPVLAQSMWLPVFAANHGFPFSELSPGKAGLPEQFVEICHIDDDSNALNNAYHDELRLLTNMMAIDAKDGTFSKLIQFPCRMNPAFSTLVREKDPVALLILAHWLAKISEVDFWWLGARVRRECFAICSYLDGWPDERFQPLLQYPMKVCGYLPIDLDLIQTYVFGM